MAKVVNIMGRDGHKHPSPNSGLAEAGFAAALGVQLGGENYYGGQAAPRPLLGDKEREMTREDILRTTNLLYRVAIALLCLAGLFWGLP
jgi:adenosylcobinamide-phosphate synthase